MRRRSLSFVVVLLIVVALAAACSSDGSSSAPAGDTGDTGATGGLAADVLDVSDMTAAEVLAADFTFGPATLQGTAGQSIELSISNVGSASHTFTIDDQSIDEEIAAGDTAVVTVTFPDSGSVTFYCRFHQGSGMEGELTVA
jgi:plastocyanin